MVDFIDYGDTTGTLGDRDRGGDQPLTAPNPSPTMPSFADFVRLISDAKVLADRAQGGDDVLDAPAPVAARTAAGSDLFGDAHTCPTARKVATTRWAARLDSRVRPRGSTATASSCWTAPRATTTGS
jgi:hypothetical protein